MKAMIFAAGLGTRLKPLTDTMPKALVPVAGKPLIAHVMDRLKEAGIRSICVNVFHFADMIIGYLRENGGSGLDITVSDERPSGLLETGGGILAAEKYLGGDGGSILIHNVDILSNLDLRALGEKVRPEDLATLVVSERKTSRYLLFDDDMLLRGWTDIRTGEVRGPAKSAEGYRKLAFSGIHVVSPEIFDVMRSLGYSGRFPIMDFYLNACASRPIRGFVPENLRMMDVGKIDTLEEAENFYNF